MSRAGNTHAIGRTPGVIVGAALVVAVIIGFIGGLIYHELNRDPVEAEASTAPTGTLEALADEADNPPPCAELLAPGRRTEQVLSEVDEGPCLNANGDTYVAVVVSWDCPDGTTVHQIGDYGWGRTAQAWNGPEVPEPYADCVQPGADAQHP